jgi:MFS family permease
VIAVLVLYVTQALALPEQGYGWMVATFAVGGVIGSFLATPVVRLCGARGCTIGTLLAFSLVVITLGASTELGVVVPTLALGGAISVVWNVVTISYRQRIVPVELLGRVTSAYRMIAFLGMPAGAVAAGVLTHAVGVSRTYLIGGFTLLLAGLVIAPFLRRMPARGTATSPENQPIPQE